MNKHTNIKNILFGCLILVLTNISTACHKEGIGGKGSIVGTVNHHIKPIPNTVVYIKYGASNFPGTDVSLYDDHSTADASAHYEFHNLRKGDYYLYGVGLDHSINETVTGGIGITIKNKEDATLDVPVTE